MPSLADYQYDFYRGGSEEVSSAASGTVGASQSVGTDVAVINNPGIGKWKIWGHGRHTQADGLRVLMGGTTLFTISSVGNSNIYFGPYVVLISNATDDIIVELAVATAASEAASATVYASKVADV